MNEKKEKYVESINYDYKKRCLIKKQYLLGDIFTNIREIKWFFEENESKFDIRLMKKIQALLNDKTKIQNKKNKINEHVELIKILYQNLPKPTENAFRCNIQIDNSKKSLIIDYYCLQSIVNIIMLILDSVFNKNEYPKILNEVLNNDYTNILDVPYWGKTLIQFKNEFNEIENLFFCLSTIHDEEINLNYTILFFYFYRIFFVKVKNVTINLNALRINMIYNNDKNPYKIRENDILLFGKKYQNLFLSNFIITSIISSYENLSALRITMSESYINEINHIFDEEFNNAEFKEMIAKKHSLIYFRQLMKIKTISNLSLIINSLDIFLFKEAINLIALHNEPHLLELELFSESKYLNLRKLYVNYLSSQEFHEMDPNIIEKYQIIMYPYVESLEECVLPLIEEEKIPDLLFPEFKKNLTTLQLILSEFIKNLKYFYINATPYEELCKYDNYNIEILLFIYFVLSTLESSRAIKRFILNAANINYCSVIQIKKKINSLTNAKVIDLSNLKELENLSLNMEGISLFLDFNKLPTDNLKNIQIDIYTLPDMKALNEALKNKKNELNNLTEIKLHLRFNEGDEIFEEFLKIFENIPNSLKSFSIIIDNIIGKLELLKLLKAMHKNMNQKNINISFNINSRELIVYLFKSKINNLKEYFMSNDALFIGKCDYNVEQISKMNISIIKWPELDIIQNIIFSLNKKINMGEMAQINNKKIYSTIFNFLGKSQNFNFVLN
jgi:hypothetical protein